MSREEARFCPFSSRHRVEFACWTANQALSSVLQARLGTERDVLVLQDRGLFDALAFFRLLHLEEFISSEMLSDLMGYFAKPRWTSLVDLVILFSVSPEEALERDIATRLSAGPGVITNITTMRRLSKAYGHIVEHYGDRFLRIESLDTMNTEVLEIARRVVQLIGGKKLT